MKTPYFDYRSNNYDEENKLLEPNYNSIDLVLSKIIESNQSDEINVCDLGCGTGRTANFIMKNHLNVKFSLIDFSSKMIKKAVANLTNFKSRIAFSVESIEHISLESNKFDYIIASRSIHHLNKVARSKLYNTAYGGLVAGGALIIFERDYSFLPNKVRDAYKLFKNNKKQNLLDRNVIDKKSITYAAHILNNESPEFEKDQTGEEIFNRTDEFKFMIDSGFNNPCIIWQDMADIIIYAEK